MNDIETTPNINEKEVCLYFSKLMKKAYSESELTSKDLSALMSLSLGLERFLKSSGNKEKAADGLLRDLRSIAAEGEGLTAINTNSLTITTGAKLITEDGKAIWLGKAIGSGGEGTVFNIPSRPGKVAKVFRSNADLNYEEKHIKAIIRAKIPSTIDGVMIAVVPETLLYTETGRFAGFIMNKLIGQTPIHIAMRAYASDSNSGNLSSLDYKGMIVLAYNLAEIVDCLHKHNVIIGDFNTNNIVVNMDGTLCLVDVNSFDITDPVSGEHFPCTVGLEEMMAPEIDKSSLVNNTFTRQSDLFSLAIIIFRLLMNNSYPFGAKMTKRTKSSASIYSASNAIRNGECIYFRRIEGKTIPENSLPLEILPVEIRHLFARVFDYSALNYKSKISERPTAEEWMKALMDYLYSPLIHCRNNKAHWYRKELKTCPFCEINKKRNVILNADEPESDHGSKSDIKTYSLSVGL